MGIRSLLKKLSRPLRRKPADQPSRTETYKRYREYGVKLSEKIMEATLSERAILSGSRALGLKGRGRELVLDSEDELSVLMDYALYEYRVEGKNAVERYQEEIGGEDKIEHELLAAMVASSPSLFKVVSISEETCTIGLSDLVNEGREIDLIDIHFSRSVKPGWLLFVRPIVLDHFSMTSGVAFTFREDLEDELLRRWQNPRSSRKKSKRPLSARRYETFFKLSKRKGIQVRYE